LPRSSRKGTSRSERSRPRPDPDRYLGRGKLAELRSAGTDAWVITAGCEINFAGLPKEVYLAAAFDEKGNYDGTSGPPPTGTPITIYDAGIAKALATGTDATITVSFDGTTRMP